MIFVSPIAAWNFDRRLVLVPKRTIMPIEAAAKSAIEIGVIRKASRAPDFPDGHSGG
jgi:hypothetical protein